MLEIAAGAAVLAGALLQSAVGFGFGLVSAPLLFAAYGPAPAVAMLTALAFVVNLATFPRHPLVRIVVVTMAWSVPGMLAGVAVLRSVDPRVLQIALTVAVFGALLARDVRARLSAPVAGVASGALAGSLAIGGPPLVLLLLGRGHEPQRLRDTLVTCFLVQSVLVGIVLVATETGEPSWTALAALVPVALIGQFAGRPLFARLANDGYERVLTGVLIVSAAVGLVAALT